MDTINRIYCTVYSMISTRHYTKESIADVLDSEYRRPNPLVNDYILFPVQPYVHKIISIR
jgi:hypothetical protein